MALTRGVVASFAVGIGVGAGGCYLYISSTKTNTAARQQNESDKRHPALRHGLPITEVLREYKGFVAAFDMRTRNPRWVIEHITAESAAGDGDRAKSPDFFEDKALEPDMRNRLSDFRNSGYDRGHLAAAANHKGSQEAMDETFTLCNISPQVGHGFNRDYWARFEKFIKDLTRKCEDVYVVTGPLWLPTGRDADGKWFTKYPMIGDPPSMVSVPTHFFKVVLAQGYKEKPGLKDPLVAAFAMPNQPLDPKTPLSSFVVPLESVEAAAGTRFFPETINPGRRRILDEAAQALRAAGFQQMRPFDRQTLIDTAPTLLALPEPDSSTGKSYGAEAFVDGKPVPVEVLSMSAPGSSASSHEQPAAVVSKAASGRARGPAVKTKPGYGVIHLCEEIACRLPPEKFWEDAKAYNEGQQAQGPVRKSSSGSHRGRRS